MEILTKQQKENFVEAELRKGTSVAEIARMLDVKYASKVQYIKDKLIAEGKITQEEIKTFREERKIQDFLQDEKTIKIKKNLLEGMFESEIAFVLHISVAYVSKIVKKLDNLGAIDKEAVEQARQKRIKEEQADSLIKEQVLMGLNQGDTKTDIGGSLKRSESGIRNITNTLIQEGKITQEEIDEAKNISGKEARKKQEILALLQQGYTEVEISKVRNFSIYTIGKVKKWAFETGQLDKKEYSCAKKERQENTELPSAKDLENYQERIQSVLDFLQEGRKKSYICSTLNLSKGYYTEIETGLIAENKITREQIEENRKQREEQIEEKVYEALKTGKSQRAIIEYLSEEGLNKGDVQKHIKHLKEKGKVTEEQIETWKKESEHGEIWVRNFVLAGLKDGLSSDKIAQADESQFLTEYRVRSAIDRLIAENVITRKQVTKWRTKRKEQDKKSRKKVKEKEDKKILSILKDGYTIAETAKQLGKAYTTVSARHNVLRKKGKLDFEKMEMVRKQRLAKEEKEVQEQNMQYQKHLSKMKRILDDEDDDEKISEQLKIFLNETVKRGNNGALTIEEVKKVANMVLDAPYDIKNILIVGKLYASMQDYQEALYFLHSARTIFEPKENDAKLISEAIETAKLAYKTDVAVRLFHKKRSIEEIQEKTGFNEGQLARIKRKYITGNQQKREYPDFNN